MTFGKIVGEKQLPFRLYQVIDRMQLFPFSIENRIFSTFLARLETNSVMRVHGMDYCDLVNFSWKICTRSMLTKTMRYERTKKWTTFTTNCFNLLECHFQKVAAKLIWTTNFWMKSVVNIYSPESIQFVLILHHFSCILWFPKFFSFFRYFPFFN